MRLIKGLGAAIVLAAALVGPPWALVDFIGNPWPAGGVDLSAPLTDNAIIGLLAAIVWVLWLQLVACISAEAVAALSDDRITVRVPLTLPVQQHYARRLVTALLLVAVATPAAPNTARATTTPSTSQPTAPIPATSLTLAAAHHQTGPQTQTAEREGTPGVDPEKAPVVAKLHTNPGHTQGQVTVTVMRLDSLWSIAERVLGDGERWPEIAALNDGRMMNDGTTFLSADHIKPGWELHLPADAKVDQDSKALEHDVVVDEGDTLSQIALEELGDADAYPEILEASKNIFQPGGRHLTDPDVIDVGWTVRIPGHAEPDNQEADQTAVPKSGPGPDLVAAPTGQKPDKQALSAEATPPPAEAGLNRPDAQPSEQPQPNQPDTTSTQAEQTRDVREHEEPITALRALLASAACLSVGALGLLAANRRRQFRQRRPGRTIASTPQELADVEQAIAEHGTEAQENVTFLDLALRHVAACCRAAGSPLPQLGAAVIGSEDLTLLFTDPAVGETPEGWSATDDARAWTLSRWTFLDEELKTQAAPYPALVSIGQDEGGRTWHLDLETLGMCGIGGAPEQVENVIRFLVAELALNAWSEGCEVLLSDEFGSETIRLNPARLRHVNRSDALRRAAVLTGEMDKVEQNLGADLLTRRRDGLLLDTTNPVVVVVPSRPEGEFVADLDHRARSRVVVVHDDERSPAVELAGDGTAFLPMWGISVKAFTLPADATEPMAALLAATRNVEDEPVPVSGSDDGPLGRYARVDGALREEYTGPRHTDGDDPSSLLPEPDEVYLATAATTPQDMAALAPSLPEQTRVEIEAIDPNLDHDLADWFDESSPRPKVHLLGPVDVTALNGGDPQALNNLAGTISFIAYLACQERGVSGERAAEACGWATQKTVQNRATNARFLLGTRPDGTDWLPDASTSDGARRGTPTYELIRGSDGVLVDVDLFVRLRFRAQKRGDKGCEGDLVTALSLVAGAPFEAATDRRFPWLFKGQRHDDIMVAAIHDVAHVLATRAIADGRTDLVRLACEAARKANPHSDVAWLDLAAATEVETGREAADDLVREQVVDRFDEDLPARTEAVLDQRDWLTG
jgi:nucleoid-associated protein YgaU